jgi:hypothetical protein
MNYKYEADKNLVQRTAFKWTILRPGSLSDENGTGKASIGRTHLTPPISVRNPNLLKMLVVANALLPWQRDDVAKALALLVDREDAAGLAIDMVGGDVPIEEGLETFIKAGQTDFLG